MISTSEDVAKFRADYGVPENVSEEQIRKGCAEESKEHSELPEETIYQLVADHLKEDPEYYEDYGSEDEDEEEEEESEAPQKVKQMSFRSDRAERVREDLNNLNKSNLKKGGY